jgi:SAM-dependent methyltransferase
MSNTAILQDRKSALRRDAFVERLLKDASGAFSLFSMYLGDRLGLYRVLAEDGALTERELAERTGTDRRCMREWLEQQIVAGVLEVENLDVDVERRRYLLPAGHDEVLADRESVNYLAPLTRLVVGAIQPKEEIVQAYRTGSGVPFEAYGEDLREGQADMNRPQFLQLMGREWIPAMPDIERILRKGAARVADIGCGAGWSAIAIARSYPGVTVDGFDLDEPSVDLARRNIEDCGLGERVRVEVMDAAAIPAEKSYDLVAAFECIHDMSDPVSALRAMRRLVKDDGAVLVVDERAGERLAPEVENLDWYLYGFSILHCLLVGMCEQPSAGTGCVMRTSTFREYALLAGFREVEVLPVDHFAFRLYRLHP